MENPMPEYDQNIIPNPEILSKMENDLNPEPDFLEVSLINEIYQTIEQLDSKCKGKVGQDIVEERIRQLSYAKVLTDVYQKDNSILIKPYTFLGEAYFDINYYEQAKEHLENAIKLNGEYEDEKILDESYIRKITFKLCKCYLELNFLDISIKMGERLLEESKNIYGEDNFLCNTELYEVLYKAYYKLNKMNQCLNYIFLLYNNYETIHGKISIKCANLTKEIAEIYGDIKKYELSIEYYIKYYDIKKQIIESDENKNFDDYEEFFQIAVKISEYYTILKNYDKSYEILKRPEKEFGEMANRTLKNRVVYQRCVIKVCSFLKNTNLYLNEYLKLEDILKNANENKKALAKTYIAIGHIYHQKKEREKSLEYFKEAKNIFEQHNDKKSLDEVEKLIKGVKKEIDNEIFS